MSLIAGSEEPFRLGSLALAGKKKTVKPDAGLAALKRANAGLQRQLDEAAAARKKAQSGKTRLARELRAARNREAASAEILGAITNTSGDADRSLQRIAEITARLFDAPSVTIRIAGENEWVRTIRVGASSQRVGAVPATRDLGGRNLPATVFQENRQIHIPDLDDLDPRMADWPGLPPARAAGTRTMCGTPLRHDGKAIGALVIYRSKPIPFTPEELALQQSFADQAAIAIENARLSNETREALARQTATSEILRVIQRVADRHTAGIRSHRADRGPAVPPRPGVHPGVRRHHLLAFSHGGARKTYQSPRPRACRNRHRRQFSIARYRDQEEPAFARLVGNRAA